MFNIVVAGGGVVRNGELVSDISRQGGDVVVIKSPLAGEIRDGRVPVDQLHARLLYGRKLTYGEVACAHGHWLAAELIQKREVGAGIVLEDDVRIIVPISHLHEIYNWASELTSPVVVVLYRHGIGQGVQSSEKELSLVRLHNLPAGTPGYIMNRPAAELALSAGRPSGFRSDWPGWAANIQFWGTKTRAIELMVAPSQVGERRNLTIWSRMLRVGSLTLCLPYLSRRSNYDNSWTIYWRHSLLPMIRNAGERFSRELP